MAEGFHAVHRPAGVGASDALAVLATRLYRVTKPYRSWRLRVISRYCEIFHRRNRPSKRFLYYFPPQTSERSLDVHSLYVPVACTGGVGATELWTAPF